MGGLTKKRCKPMEDDNNIWDPLMDDDEEDW